MVAWCIGGGAAGMEVSEGASAASCGGSRGVGGRVFKGREGCGPLDGREHRQHKLNELLNMNLALSYSTRSNGFFVTALAVVLLGVGCSKEADPAAAVPAAPAPAPAAADASTASGAAVGAAAAAASSAAAAASDAATKAASQAQELIDKLKAAISGKRSNEAADLLAQLTKVQLTPEQQRVVDDLKSSMQKAVADQAVGEGKKALGDALKIK